MTECMIPLTVKERLALGAVVPRQQNYITLMAMRRVLDALALTESEIVLLGLTVDGQVTRWSDEGEKAVGSKIINFGEISYTTLKGVLKKLNDENKLGLDQLSLYEKFVETKPEMWQAKERGTDEVDKVQ